MDNHEIDIFNRLKIILEDFTSIYEPQIQRKNSLLSSLINFSARPQDRLQNRLLSWQYEQIKTFMKQLAQIEKYDDPFRELSAKLQDLIDHNEFFKSTLPTEHNELADPLKELLKNYLTRMHKAMTLAVSSHTVRPGQ